MNLFVRAVLGAVGLAVFGATNVFVGIAEQHAANHTYVVDFRHPGDDCGPDAVTFDVTDGEPLSCEQTDVHPLDGVADLEALRGGVVHASTMPNGSA